MGRDNGKMNGAPKDTLVLGQTSQGSGIHATLLRLARHSAAFEIYNPALVLRTSEVLHDFRIVSRERTIYSGRAVVRSLVDAGLTIVCEVSLSEGSWTDVLFSAETVKNDFAKFLQEWQRLYKIEPGFKVVMADLHSFLSDLRLWLEQIELEIRSSPSKDRNQLEHEVIDSLAEAVVSAMDSFIERFEQIAGNLEPETQALHQGYLRRQVHPLILSSPFAYRTYHKPLGYAGDYEIVDMMLRPPYEGGTLFAKIINVWLLGQAPAQAHRNRVGYLERKLLEEIGRVERTGRRTRVFDLGCGPAAEVQRLVRDHKVAEHAQFTLMDFNEETLQHSDRVFRRIFQECGAQASIQFVKKSVHQLLKESARATVRSPDDRYDFIYSAGLFDYLSDNVCRRLVNIFYDWLAPGGLLLVSNVSDRMNNARPFRYSMEYILDWHLIYRDGNIMASLAPERASRDSTAVISEDSGVNVFLEIRKPSNV